REVAHLAEVPDLRNAAALRRVFAGGDGRGHVDVAVVIRAEEPVAVARVVRAVVVLDARGVHDDAGALRAELARGVGPVALRRGGVGIDVVPDVAEEAPRRGEDELVAALVAAERALVVPVRGVRRGLVFVHLLLRAEIRRLRRDDEAVAPVRGGGAVDRSPL